jgi:hypothetical protein
VQITQIHIRAYPSHKLNYRATRVGGMKEFVEGTAIKFTMIIDEPEATCTITIDDPTRQVVVDAEGMTQEKDYVYSYVYQSLVTHFGKGDWLVTFKATLSGKTALTQDVFSLLDNRRIGNT